jgi:hypothetical protein
MATTAIATLQPVWDCRWSQPGHRLTGVSDALQPETDWVCVREGNRRNIGPHECATCPHWEWDVATRTNAGGSTMVVAYAPVRSARALEPPLLVVLAVLAAILVATGVAVLTNPMMLPLTIALWLGAAAVAGFAVFGSHGE